MLTAEGQQRQPVSSLTNFGAVLLCTMKAADDG